MECIICKKEANATGSHVVPASLIKSCVGKHYKEESYKIDGDEIEIDVFYGQENLKNTNPEIKENHYKMDNILCQECEDKLAILEGKIYNEFIQKFRDSKFQNNFESKQSKCEFQLMNPKKISTRETLAYFYSIILRFCHQNLVESGYKFISDETFKNISEFLNSYFYKEGSEKSISNYKLVIIFNRESENGSQINSSNIFKDPHVFFFCEAIIQLYTTNTDAQADKLFSDCYVSLETTQPFYVVGPEDLFNSITSEMWSVLAETYITNGITQISQINKISYSENFNEFKKLAESLNGEDRYVKAMQLMKKKYSA